MYHHKNIEIKEFIGKTFTGIKNNGEEIFFTCEDGTQIRMYHDQSCCENVNVEDINGDLMDLVGSPILMAREAVYDDENPDGVTKPEYQESFTWTFYHFATIKGYVTVRWYGSSNGYYSESVSICEMLETEDENI